MISIHAAVTWNKKVKKTKYKRQNRKNNIERQGVQFVFFA